MASKKGRKRSRPRNRDKTAEEFMLNLRRSVQRKICPILPPSVHGHRKGKKGYNRRAKHQKLAD